MIYGCDFLISIWSSDFDIIIDQNLKKILIILYLLNFQLLCWVIIIISYIANLKLEFSRIVNSVSKLEKYKNTAVIFYRYFKLKFDEITYLNQE